MRAGCHSGRGCDPDFDSEISISTMIWLIGIHCVEATSEGSRIFGRVMGRLTVNRGIWYRLTTGPDRWDTKE